MYEIYPDKKSQWILYEVGGGNFNVIGLFPDKADAEFAKQAFEKRDGTAKVSPTSRKQRSLRGPSKKGAAV